MKLLDRFAASSAAHLCHDRSLSRLPQPPDSSPSSPQHTSRPLAPHSSPPSAPLTADLSTCLWPLPSYTPFPDMHMVPLESLSLADCSPSATPAPFLLAPLSQPLHDPCLRGPHRQGVRQTIRPSPRFVKLFPNFFSFFCFPLLLPSPFFIPPILFTMRPHGLFAHV